MTGTWYRCPDCDKQVDCSNGVPVDCPHCVTERKQAKKTKQEIAVIQPSPIHHNDDVMSFGAYKRAAENTVSKEEYHRYVMLHGLHRDGIIHRLELQPSYLLLNAVVMPGVNWYSWQRPSKGTRYGFSQQSKVYSPDFCYEYKGVQVIEEYKSIRRTSARNHVPRWLRGDRDKIRLFISLNQAKLKSGEWFFTVVGWNKYTGLYNAFDPNGNMIDYPLDNYTGTRKQKDITEQRKAG